MEWSQPALPFDEPVNILPRDGRARMIFAWRGKSGRLDRRWAAEVDDVPTIRQLLRGQPDVYDTQWWMDRPIHRHAFALAGTHAYVDLDFYKVPALADRKPDAVGKALLRHCDETGLPRPSAIVGSGRGLYPKWCFAEPVGREDVGKMVALNRAFARKLAAYGADMTATDATRLLRATGTWHSGAGRMVEVLHLEQQDGRTITYDAGALAAQLVPNATKAPDADTIIPATDFLNREARRDRAFRNHRFSRETWFWTITEDMRQLARMRYRGGIVPKGWRDTFALLVACQMLRIFPPAEAYRETVAILSTMIEPDFLRKELEHLTSTAMRLAREAWAGRGWIHTYRYGKRRLIELLEITQAEMRHMRALIDEAEYLARHAARERDRRAAAGAMDRATYLDRRAEAAGERGAMARLLKAEGRTWAEVAAIMRLPSAAAARMLAARA